VFNGQTATDRIGSVAVILPQTRRQAASGHKQTFVARSLYDSGVKRIVNKPAEILSGLLVVLLVKTKTND